MPDKFKHIVEEKDLNNEESTVYVKPKRKAHMNASAASQGKKLERIQGWIAEAMESPVTFRLIGAQNWDVAAIKLSANEKTCTVYWRRSEEAMEKNIGEAVIQDRLNEYCSVIQRGLILQSTGNPSSTVQRTVVPRISFKPESTSYEARLDEAVKRIEQEMYQSSLGKTI